MKPSKALTFCMLAFSSLIPSFSESLEDERECFTSRATIRHKEPNGIGYNQGYSTLEVFGAPRYLSNANILPFIDARLHLFNNGDPAVNAGVGARYHGGKFIWGINSYYDYRKTSHWHYNQYSLGLEMLGKRFDIRLNGYLPLGSKESKYYDKKFSHFEDHYAIISRKREFAMKGGNAEFGYHIRDLKKISVYGALGPYYFTNHGKNAIGGEGRINVTFLNHIKLELSGSYDQVFKWIGQGEAGLYISFGPKVKVKKKKNASSYTCDILAQRLTQPVDRQEIVVLDKYKKRSKAIDPSTNSPYYFVFVDNQSHSLGTYESPYTTLANAENASSPGDILYVFPGDGTAYDMGTTGLQLQDNQKLFGSGTNQSIVTSLGNILIPSQTSTMPNIIASGNTTSGIVNLADNNEISGMNFSGSNIKYSIYGGTQASPIDTTLIHDNSINGAYTLFPIYLTGVGNLFIKNNIFNVNLTSNNTSAIIYNLYSGKSNVQISENTLTSNSTTNISAGIYLNAKDSAECFANIFGNTISQNSTSTAQTYGMFLSSAGSSSILHLSVEKNEVNVSVNANGGFSQGIFAKAGTTGSYLDGYIQLNNVTTATTAPATTNKAPSKGIAFDNNSTINPVININNNNINTYSNGTVNNSIDTSIAGIRIKNYSEPFTCNVYSNSISVIGLNANDSIYGISCLSTDSNKPITGSIILNTGSVTNSSNHAIGIDDTGMEMVNLNNNIQTSN